MPLLIISGCISLLLAAYLLFEKGSPSALISKRLHKVFAVSAPKTRKNQLAFQKQQVHGAEYLIRAVKDRVSGAGGTRALLPIVILALIVGIISYYLTTQYGVLIAAIAGMSVTGIITTAGYKYKIFQIQKEFDQNLPLAIDLVMRAVSAGVALPASFEHVAQSISGTVGKEFQILFDSIKIGMPVQSALEQGIRRIPSTEFNYFAIILGLNIETGGKLSESLGNLSEKLRSRRHMERKAKSMTAEPRMSALIVAFFPPTFLGLLYLLNKDQFFFLFTDATGKTLLGYAATSITLGLLQIYRMTRVPS